MSEISTSELRNDLPTALNRVAFGGDRIVIHRNNKQLAALVSMEDLALLRGLEDRNDRETMRKALNEPGDDTPWDQAKKELGL